MVLRLNAFKYRVNGHFLKQSFADVLQNKKIRKFRRKISGTLFNSCRSEGLQTSLKGDSNTVVFL